MTATAEVFIDLLRHGETEGGPRIRGSIDDPLTPRGREQMQSAVGDVRHWMSIISSPARRCAEFSRQLAQRLSLPLKIDERLREIHFGTWEGKSAAELLTTDATTLAHFWTDPAAHAPPGSEPLAQFQARVLAAWADIIAHPAGENILLITHGGPIRMILGHVLVMPLYTVLRLEVPHASLSRLRLQFNLEGRPVPSLVFHAGRL